MVTMAPTLKPVRLLWPRKRFKSVMAYLEKKAPTLIQHRDRSEWGAGCNDVARRDA